MIEQLIFNKADICKVWMVQGEDRVWRDLNGIPIAYSNNIPQGEVIGIDKEGNIVAAFVFYAAIVAITGMGLYFDNGWVIAAGIAALMFGTCKSDNTKNKEDE